MAVDWLRGRSLEASSLKLTLSSMAETPLGMMGLAGGSMEARYPSSLLAGEGGSWFYSCIIWIYTEEMNNE